MKVSILVPVKNTLVEYTLLSIKSILTQSSEHIHEVVVVDSSANSKLGGILSALDNRIVYYFKPELTGIVPQLNFGLKKCTGELIARMDADDIAHPSRIEIQRDFLLRHPDIAAVGANVDVIDEGGALVGRWNYPTCPELVKKSLQFGNSICHPVVMFRKCVVTNLGGYADYPYAEDYELWVRMSVSGYNLTNLSSRLLSYRIHLNSTKSTKVKQTLKSTIDIKVLYYRESIKGLSKFKLTLERIALFLPSRLVYKCLIYMRTKVL